MLRSVGVRLDAPRQLEPLGTHAVIGGAFDSPAIFHLMRETAKAGARPRIAVILSSKQDRRAALAAYFRDTTKHGKVDPSIRRWFDQHGFEPVYIPLTADTAATWAYDRRLAELIASCDAVYLAGGDQAKHVRALLDADGSDTPILGAIRSVAAKGGLVSGSSAGAAVQGGLQYGEGEVYDYLAQNRLIARDFKDGTLYNEEAPGIGSIQRGLALLRDDMLVCTHFDQRFRLGRLLVALRHGGPMTGIGVDEDTGLFVRGSEGRVAGSHGVFFVDPSAARYGDGPHFSVEGVRLTYLTHGDRIDVDTLEAAPDKPRTPRREGGTITRDDILSPMAMTKLIEEMIRTGASRAVGYTKETVPRFAFELLRDPQTRTYDDGRKVSAARLVLNVRAVP